MNLHAIVRGAITTVNPDTTAGYQKATGYTTSAAGKRTPAYAASVDVPAQVQAAGGSDLEHTEYLNIAGVYRAVYMYGNTQGVVRPDAKGGDLLSFAQVPGGTVQTWLVIKVDETWPDWCRVIVCLQL